MNPPSSGLLIDVLGFWGGGKGLGLRFRVCKVTTLAISYEFTKKNVELSV